MGGGQYDSRSARTLIFLVSLLATAALAPSPAGASPALEVGIQDDALLTYGAAETAMSGWREIGIRRVRYNVVWNKVAPAPFSTRGPEAFDGSDHRDPGYDWSRVDRAVRGAAARGLRVQLTITGPGPVWASASPGRRLGVWKPSVDGFARFAGAVAARYQDETDLYSIYNEPNQAGWLQPQSVKRKGRYEPYAPHYYRRLVRAAYPQIRARDASAHVLIGELAPSGHNRVGHRKALRPLPFLRSFGCVDRKYRPVRDGYCRNFRSAVAGGIAHHSHAELQSPQTRSANIGDAQIADTSRLLRVVDRLQRKHRLRKPGKGKLSAWFTEVSYQTNPPDPDSGIPPYLQAQWMQEAQYVMWRHPRVRGWTQYVYKDEPERPGRERWLGWQSGLFDVDGKAKPYAASYIDPIWASRTTVRRGSATRIWGQYKPDPGAVVRLLYRNRGSSRWRLLRRVRTDRAGYFSVVLRPGRSRDYRFDHERGSSDQTTVTVRR
ncbi:MAG: hypothetical protein ACR2NA_07965 [Solirubrobacterales bacterium]